VIEKKLKVLNRLGIHARPAALIVQTAGKYKSKIELSKGKLEVNGKSIMGVMMLAAECGSEIIIRASGEDEKEAIASLISLIESKFNED